jgi:hypothetical protein
MMKVPDLKAVRRSLNRAHAVLFPFIYRTAAADRGDFGTAIALLVAQFSLR